MRAVRPSYMLTDLLSKIEMYTASENLLPLSRDSSASTRTMSTVQAGYRTG